MGGQPNSCVVFKQHLRDVVDLQQSSREIFYKYLTMRATEFLTEYVGMNEPFPDLHQDPDSVPNNVLFYAQIPNTDKELIIVFWNLVSTSGGPDNFKVMDISFGIRRSDRIGTNYEPPTGIQGTPQASVNARLMYRILSTVTEAIDRYIAEYGRPHAFSFTPSTQKLAQLYSRLEPKMTKKYGYTPVSLIKLGDIASSVTKYDFHEVFQYFDIHSEYFVRNDLNRPYD